MAGSPATTSHAWTDEWNAEGDARHEATVSCRTLTPARFLTFRHRRSRKDMNASTLAVRKFGKS